MRLRILLILLIALVASGCSARAKLDVDVAANGSGVITVELRLDPDAAAAVPDLAEQLHKSDLEASGWKVSGPTKSGRDTVVKATRPFDDVGQANRLLAEVSGAGGVFRDLQLTQQRSLARVNTQFSGTIDLSDGLAVFGDSTLQTRTGFPLGFDVGEAQRALAVDPQRSFPVEVVVHLPGGQRESTPTIGENGEWQGAYGKAVNVSARANGWNVWPITFLVLAGLSALSAFAVMVLWPKYRPRHRAKNSGVRAKDLLQSRSED